MEDDKRIETPLAIKENDIKGEKIIFDIPINEKLAHVIIIKDDHRYHVNVDGEDLGSFYKKDDGSISRDMQAKGANTDPEEYFSAIEAKLKELNK